MKRSFINDHVTDSCRVVPTRSSMGRVQTMTETRAERSGATYCTTNKGGISDEPTVPVTLPQKSSDADSLHYIVCGIITTIIIWTGSLFLAAAIPFAVVCAAGGTSQHSSVECSYIQQVSRCYAALHSFDVPVLNSDWKRRHAISSCALNLEVPYLLHPPSHRSSHMPTQHYITPQWSHIVGLTQTAPGFAATVLLGCVGDPSRAASLSSISKWSFRAKGTSMTQSV